MSDADHRLYEAQRDAEQARALVDNKMLARCFALLRDELLTEITASALDHYNERERAYQMIRAVAMVENKIQAMAASGEFAARSLRSRLS